MAGETPAFSLMAEETVLMHGPAFDGSGDIVERQVPKQDITAYRNAGYELGKNPTKTIEDAVEEVIARKRKK